MSRYSFVVASAAVALSWGFACSPKSGAANANGGNIEGGVNNGTGANNGSGANSGSGANGSAGGGVDIGLGTGEGLGRDGGGEDAKCAALVLKPEAIKVKTNVKVNCTAETPEPISIYLMLDNSGSMKDNNKWTDAVAAITAFVQSDPTALGTPWVCVDKDGKDFPPPPDLPPPGSGSISVAIQYFHPENVGASPDECAGVAHRTPAVPMDVIPANAPPITGSLGMTGPNGNTPTVGALKGGVDYCTAYQAANPDKRCVLVLVTDGQPNGCGLSSNCPTGGGNDCVDPNSASTLTPIAGNAFNNPTDSVITFTVGMNGVNAAGFDLLNQVAIAGGSDCTPGTPGNETCNVTTGGSQGFLDALNTIRKSVQVTGTSSQAVQITETTTLPCEWTIPTPTNGQKFDKTRVNVTFSDGGATTEKVGNVPTEAECTAAGGWYYDDPGTPTRILTCPDTCTKIKTTAGAHVDVLFGCLTEPVIIH